MSSPASRDYDAGNNNRCVGVGLDPKLGGCWFARRDRQNYRVDTVGHVRLEQIVVDRFHGQANAAGVSV